MISAQNLPPLLSGNKNKKAWLLFKFLLVPDDIHKYRAYTVPPEDREVEHIEQKEL